MKASNFTEAQKAFILRQGEEGTPSKASATGNVLCVIDRSIEGRLQNGGYVDSGG